MEVNVEEIYNRYLNGDSVCNVLSKEYNMNYQAIYKLFKKHGYTMKNNKEKSLKYSCDEHYFDAIDTQDKAYWLGYICADGYITQDMKYFGISLSSRDKYILEQLNNDLSSTYNIKHYTVTNGYKIGTEYDRLLISNSVLVQGLYSHGVIPQKLIDLNLLLVFYRN